MKTSDGRLDGHLFRCPGYPAIFRFADDKIDIQSIRILEGKVLLAEPFADLTVPGAELAETAFPKLQTAFGHGIAYSGCHTCTRAAFTDTLPWKESEDGTGSTCFIPKIKVICSRVVKVHRFF